MSAVLSVWYIRIRLLLLLVLGWRLVLRRIFQILTGFFGILFIVFLYLLVVLVCIRFILFYVVGFIFLAVPFCRRISLWCRLLCLNLLTLPRVGRIGLLSLGKGEAAAHGSRYSRQNGHVFDHVLHLYSPFESNYSIVFFCDKYVAKE